MSKEIRRKTMQAIRSKDTKMELAIRKALFALGLRYRKNVSNLPGKPDIVFKKRKIAVFLDSCFWHACPLHFRKPSSNTFYWDKKIERNQLRDRAINDWYLSNDWVVLRFWEHEVMKEPQRVLDSIREAVMASQYAQQSDPS